MQAKPAVPGLKAGVVVCALMCLASLPGPAGLPGPFSFPAQAAAASRGSREEALALAERAAAFLRERGIDAARQALTDPAGGFIDRDLYVTVLDLDGNMLIHGANPRLVGRNLMDLKDLDNRYFIREAIELGKAQPEGWVEYRWTDPLTKKISNKKMHVRRVGDYLLNVGIYEN